MKMQLRHNKKPLQNMKFEPKILVIILLCIIIVGTLNYFNILPLSSKFALFSFLPHQGEQIQNSMVTSSPVSKKIPEQQQVISPDKPMTFSNDKNSDDRLSIPDSNIRVLKDLQIDVEFSNTKTNQTPSNATAGYIFDNDLPADNKNLRLLYLFYYFSTNTWNLEYLYDGKTIFFPNILKATGQIYGKFSLNISSFCIALKIY